ncbi:MAG: class I SAM-dependent methyltransferase [Bryobacteraceae bacterium]|jgi:hypothetical protein
MGTATIPESFYMYLWRSPTLPGTLYVAQGFEETEALYRGLAEDGYIVKLIHTATNAEFELSAGRLCPSPGSLLPSQPMSQGLSALATALRPLRLRGQERLTEAVPPAEQPTAPPFAKPYEQLRSNLVTLGRGLTERVGLQAARWVARVVPKRILCSRRFFHVWEANGYHVVPLFYESPVPQPSEIAESLWQQPSEMVATQLREKAQLGLLDAFQSRFKTEFDAFPRNSSNGRQRFHLNNGWFEKIDAEILYSMIRAFRPARMIEIGSGVTTTLSAQAIRKNQEDSPGYDCEFTAIEPFPARLDPDTLPPNFRLIEERVQQVPLKEFSALQANDILFIDSSHVCRTGSDVNYEILEILPRLSKGVLIHFHDIFLPWEYPRSWVIGDHRFLSEQYMLQAFLTYNPEFEVVWGSYYMLRKNPEALKQAFATFRENITAPGTFLPGSFWIRRVA